jgi:Zn-dependent protease with chaperone function
MIGDLARFAIFNLGASILAGLLVAVVVLGASRVLGIRDARVRSWLLGAALVKSTLVLAGLGTVLTFPSDRADAIGGGALPISVVGPLIVVWAGAVLVLRDRVTRSLRLSGVSGPVHGASDRLTASVARLAAVARRLERSDGPCFRCTVPDDLPTPAARVSRAGAPATIDPAGEPVIELPEGLLAALDDDELDGVVAHEIGHVVVARDREGCAPVWARVARWTSPGAAVVGILLDREEELACDELAVRITGQPTALASALLKAYRRRRATAPALTPVANLLGGSRLLKDRVEHLASAESDRPAPSLPRVAAACAVTLLVSVAL